MASILQLNPTGRTGRFFTAQQPRRAARVHCSVANGHHEALGRRQILIGTTVGALAVAAPPKPAVALDASKCELATAPNGLQYCDEVVGEGKPPAAGAMIRCHYTGRLASNNAVFDSSYDRGKPLQFKIGVGQVIKGWDQGILGGEGIPAMKEGGKRRLIIPSELAYGERGAGRGLIPPNATLVFDVELMAPYGAR